MCVIIDNNVAARVLLKRDDPDFCQLSIEIESGSARIVYGGKLMSEYGLGSLLMKRILSLDRAGRARQVNEIKYQTELEIVESGNLCLSNDTHIIALARAGNARLICTNDISLMRDVKNPELLNHPRGKVYSRSSCHHLIRTCCKK